MFFYSLRKTHNPNQEHCRRSESSLKVWVQEAKNIPAKKRYSLTFNTRKLLVHFDWKILFPLNHYS